MSAQPPARPEVFIDSHSILRERTFIVRNVEHALSIIKMEHATGKLILNLTNGSVGSIQFEERAKLTSR